MMRMWWRRRRDSNQVDGLHSSNVAQVDPESGAATRVGVEVKDGEKVRVAKRSGKALA